MSNKRRLLYCLITGIVLGNIVFWTNRCSKPVVESVERDTIIVHDTIVDIAPVPKDSVRTRWITRWLPAKRDTSRNVCSENKISVSSAKFSASFPQDSALVEIPITSKHYQSPEYDAWVSGFEPSLDSIKVYQRTKYITERVTISKPPNKYELDLVGGINYKVQEKKYTPYAGGELMYKPNRFQIGIRGGVEYTDKIEPVIGGVVKIRLY